MVVIDMILLFSSGMNQRALGPAKRRVSRPSSPHTSIGVDTAAFQDDSTNPAANFRVYSPALITTEAWPEAAVSDYCNSGNNWTLFDDRRIPPDVDEAAYMRSVLFQIESQGAFGFTPRKDFASDAENPFDGHAEPALRSELDIYPSETNAVEYVTLPHVLYELPASARAVSPDHLHFTLTNSSDDSSTEISSASLHSSSSTGLRSHERTFCLARRTSCWICSSQQAQSKHQ